MFSSFLLPGVSLDKSISLPGLRVSLCELGVIKAHFSGWFSGSKVYVRFSTVLQAQTAHMSRYVQEEEKIKLKWP